MQALGEIPEQFTKRYWKSLLHNTWAFQMYFPLIFEYLGDYSGPVPTIEEAEDVVIATFEKSVGSISSSAWLPPDATRRLAQQLRDYLSLRTKMSDEALTTTPPLKGNPKRFDGLNHKVVDMARYIDAANLTDRQRDCFSLVFEYGLSKTEAAKRLGHHRSTVDEHLEAAKKRIRIAEMKRKQRPSGH